MAIALVLLVACAPPCGVGEICTLAGAEVAGFNGEGLPAPESWLYLPSALTLNPAGAPCIVDFNNHRLRCLDAGTLVTVAGNGEHGYSVPGANLLETPLENPIDAVWDAEGRLLLLPTHESRVIANDAEGNVVVIAGTGDEGYTGDGGPATEATFAQPGGLAVADDGALWVADTLNAAVRRVGLDGVVTTVLADIPGVQRVRPGVDGHVLVADAFAGRVLDLAPDGTTTLLGDGYLYPWSARLGHDGAIYVASSGDHQIFRLVDGEDELIAGSGEAGFSGDGGPAVEASLSWPSDTLLLDDGTLLIADMQGGRVRSILTDLGKAGPPIRR